MKPLRHLLPITLVSAAAPIIALYFLLLATTVLYWPGLGGGWVLDDFENLMPLKDLDREITTLRDAITTNNSGALGRSVAMLTFAVDQLAHGGDLWYFKYTNLLLHLLSGTLVFWLTARLFQQHTHRWWLVVSITALWLLAPLQVSTVLYTVQRMTQLAAVFSLAGMLSYVIGRQVLDQRRGLGLGLILSTFLVWWPLASLSKENGLLLPAFTLLIEVMFFSLPNRIAERRVLVSLYIAIFLTGLIAAAAILHRNPTFITQAYETRDFTMSERLLTQPRALADYARQLLLPNGPSLGIYHDDFQKSVGILSPPSTLLAIAFWISLVGAAHLMRKTEMRYVLFGITFFLVGHLLESTIFALELYFEHRNYLPSYGLFVALALFGSYLAERLRAKTAFVVLATLLPLSYAAATYQRVHAWASNDSLILSAEQAHPNSPRVHGDLAVYYMNLGDLANSSRHLDRMATLDPTTRPAIAVQRIVAHCLARRTIPNSAYEALHSDLSLSQGTYLVASLRTLSELLAHNRCSQLDVRRFSTILGGWLRSLDTEKLQGRNLQKYWLLNIYFAQMLGHAGLHTEALPYLDMAAGVVPTSLEPGLIKIRFQLALRDIRGAKQTLVQLQERDQGRRVDFTNSIQEYDKYLASLAAPNPSAKP